MKALILISTIVLECMHIYGRPQLPSEDQFYYYDDFGRIDPDTKPSSSSLAPSTDSDQVHMHKVPPRLHELESKLNHESYDSYHAAAWEIGLAYIPKQYAIPTVLFFGESAKIDIQIHIESFSDFKADQNNFYAEMYLRKQYSDPRLAHHAKRHLIVNEPHLIAQIWKPDLYFANAQETSVNAVTKPHQLLKVFPDGRIHHSIKLSAKMTCHLALHAYPVDNQECKIRIMSYAHPSDELLLFWNKNNALTYNSEIMLPEMHILSIEPRECDGTFENETFSCLEARVRMERRITAHLLQTYLPSAIIVAISWVSFWIDPYAVPARVTLSFTTLLTLTTQAAGIRLTAPAIAYAKALDYWMGTCTVMVLLALLEYTLVNSYLQRAHQSHLRQKQKKDRRRLELLRERLSSSEKGETTLLRETSDRPLSMLTERTFVLRAYRVDTISKFLFPATFLVFNITYWSLLLSS